uniref:Replication protein A C-terminal domain-containing protein n=1 Tax=Gorilla gorilla gorilla TaxID=9595 RepID=A0A2I2YNT9_GORGO
MWKSGFESYGSSLYWGSSSYMQSPGAFGLCRAQHIVPCTISKLLSATLIDEVFKIGNVEISQVTIKAPTNIVYKIDDMTTAPVDVRQWVDTDDTGSENTVIPPEKYVIVAGDLRPLQDKKSLFTIHILEVINVHMILSKANRQPSAGRAPISNPGMSEAGKFGGNNFMPVLNLIKRCPRPKELNFQDLKNQLNHMSVSSIKQAVDFLSNEGHIYSSVDDYHFKSTDAE